MSSPWSRGSGRLTYRGHERPAIGVRWELFIIDAQTGAPAPAVDTLLQGQPDISRHASPGLFRCIVRVESGLCPTLGIARDVLERTIEILTARAENRGLALVGMGTHPFAEWAEQEMTHNPEVDTLLLRMKWIIRRMLTCGLHVLIATPDGEKAIAVSSALSGYVPLFLAYAGNSAYWRGVDTGLASCRIRLIDNIPTGGIPPSFINWAEFQLFLNTLRAANAIEGFHQIWWDIHPDPDEGAIEVGACDSVSTIEEVTVIAALAQAITMGLLDQYDNGETLLSLDHWVKQENRWRAARFGTDCELIAGREGDLMHFPDFAKRARELVIPIAEKMGTAPALHEIENVFRFGIGSARQRAAAASGGGHAAVLAHMRREFVAGRPLAVADALPPDASADAGSSDVSSGNGAPAEPAPKLRRRTAPRRAKKASS